MTSKCLEALYQAASGRFRRLGDEAMLDAVGGAAQCEEPCIIGVLSTEVLEARYTM